MFFKSVNITWKKSTPSFYFIDLTFLAINFKQKIDRFNKSQIHFFPVVPIWDCENFNEYNYIMTEDIIVPIYTIDFH